MGRITANSGNFECQVGGVYHVCYYTPSSIQDVITKKGKDKCGITDGRAFPYIAHYMTTGDLIYPAHEGEGSISSLLEEVDRLNLIPHLFQNGSPSSSGAETLNRSSKKNNSFDSNAKLRIRTRNERWDGMGKAFAKMLKIPTGKGSSQGHPVYRPPVQNKGQTVVIVRSCLQGHAQIKVHGPSPLLGGLLPDARPASTPVAHQQLNAHLIPSTTSANSIVMTLEEHGFVLTVRSSWAEVQTGGVITQWILFRRGSNKSLSSLQGGTSKKSSSLSRLAASSRKRSESTKKNVENHTSKESKLNITNNQAKKTPLRESTDSINAVRVNPDASNDKKNSKNSTLERPPSRWGSISENLSSSSVFSRSLNVITGSSNTLQPKKGNKIVLNREKKNINTLQRNQIKTPQPPSNEKDPKSKPVTKWTKTSIKRVVAKLF